jgi:phosphotransferase system enzyme I (PtsI)
MISYAEILPLSPTAQFIVHGAVTQMQSAMTNGRILRGDGVVDGIALDSAVVSDPEKIAIPKYHVRVREVHRELNRYRHALRSVKKRLREDQHRVASELGTDEADILKTHILITQDPFFMDEVPATIAAKRRNAEWVIKEGLNNFLKTFKNIDNIFFKERGRDIEDVSLRVIRSLMGEKDADQVKDFRGILVVNELVPSMIMHIDTDRIRGIVAETGSETSHATILAKSLGIPVIINVREATTLIESGDPLIVDGNIGQVVLDPSERVVAEYNKLQQKYEEHLKDLEATHDLPATTVDGTTVSLYANIEFLPGADLALRYGAEGIGLFRTELPFLVNNRLLTEKEQLSIYTSLLRSFADKPVTIRTLDIGGDKFFPFQQSMPFIEPNPFLGLRSIRVSLHRPEIFKVQIRALLKASVEGRLSMLLPMISTYEEMESVISIIEREKSSLRKKGIPFDENMEIGIMIEIPSAALAAPYLIELCDFFSIGTNDLIQYTLAVDRTNENVSSYYIPENPSVLRLVDMTARAAVSAGKPCAVCGELAGNPLFAPFFLGVGIRQLSMEAMLIPQIKELIRTKTLTDCRELADEVLGCRKADHVQKLLQDFSGGGGG